MENEESKALRKGGRGNRYYDWDALEDAFVKGDFKILQLARESTGLDTSPTYAALRKRAANHKWYAKREEYQEKQKLLPPTEEERKAALEMRSAAEKLVDAATVIEEHLRLSKTLKAMYGSLGVKVRQAIDALNPKDLTAPQILNAINVLTNVLQAATELERKSLSLADPLQQIEVTTRYVVSLTPAGEPQEANLDNVLSLEEWAAKYSTSSTAKALADGQA